MVVMEENWIVGIPYKKYNKQRAVLTSSDLKLLNCLLASSLAAYTQHILLAYSCHLSGFFLLILHLITLLCKSLPFSLAF